MLGNLTFTLYEIFGYLLPGGVTLFGVFLVYWALFLPSLPIRFSYQPGWVACAIVAVASYLLGHAVQAMGNALLPGAEAVLLDSAHATAPAWMRERANSVALSVSQAGAAKIEPKWTFRTLDEYGIQAGNPGDREMFVYREGFYRGTSIALFLLAIAMLVRMLCPGAAIRFSNGVFFISDWQILLTALLIAGVGRLFVRRYSRFSEYRVTQAMIAAIVLHSTRPEKSTEGSASSAKAR